jgi:hypothetical protein
VEKMIRKVGELTFVAFLAQAVSFAALPLIANIFGPSEFGRFSILVASTSLLIPLATLKLETVVVVEKCDQKTSLYLKTAMIATIAVASVALIIVGLMSLFERFILDINFDKLWFLAPMFICVNSLVVMSQQVLLRKKLYRKFGLTGIIQSSIVVSSQIGIGVLFPKSVTLCTGWLIGRLTGVYWSLGVTKKLWVVQKGSGLQYFKRLKDAYSEFRFLNQGSLFESIAVAFPTIYIGNLYGNDFAGLYSLAQILLMAPIVLVGSSLGSWILSEVGNFGEESVESNERIRLRLRKILIFLFALVPIYIVLNYSIGFIVAMSFLGNEWKSSFELLSLMIVPYSIGLVWYPLVNLFWAKQDWVGYRHFSFLRMILPISLAIFSYITSMQLELTVSLLSWGAAASQLIGIYLLNRRWKFLNPKNQDFNF